MAASEETDSGFYTSPVVIPKTVLEDLCRLVFLPVSVPFLKDCFSTKVSLFLFAVDF